MNIEQYIGLCGCGRKHDLLTRKIIIEQGATEKLGEIADELGLSGSGCVICDENTKRYAEKVRRAFGGRLHSIEPFIILDPAGLHADEKAVGSVNSRLPEDAGWLIAVGSGTIHDITRYVANNRKISFISYPTAASVDGFVSTVSAMTWHGFKKTLPGVAPVAVAADTNVFSKAPSRLTRAGVGDVLGKYVSLADWEISSLVSGENFCSRIASLTMEAAERVREGMEDIGSGNAAAYENLMRALLLSGIAMQMWGNSRPASGAEHHLSHFWEMEILNSSLDALHGEKVGIGLLTVLPIYKKIADAGKIRVHINKYEGLPAKLLKSKYAALYDEIIKENTPDPLEGISVSKLEEHSGEITRILDALPDPNQLRSDMERLGCLTSPDQLGLSKEQVRESVILSPYVRNRLTLLRIAKLLVEDGYRL